MVTLALLFSPSNRDRSNLWLLGGEIIRRHDDPDLQRLPIDQLVRQLIKEDGGPSSGRAYPRPNKTPSTPPAESSIDSSTSQHRQNDRESTHKFR
jgi:hypothetical protein